ELPDGRSVLTGQNGSFFFREVEPGTQPLRVTALGWRQEPGDEATVAEGDTTRVSVALFRDVIPLPALLIQPGAFGLLEDVSPGTARTLTREEIQTLPQLGEDVFRAMKPLPGVASGDISTRLNLRGGPDREILVRLDGLELYEPYHVKDWGGALGIVDINLLGGVEIQSGGFGVQHGDRMTGVLDMTSRRPEGDLKTTLGLSVSSATIMSRGTFDTERGAWLFSARRGFLDLVMDLANEGRRLSPEYHDVFGKVTYEIGSRHRIGARFLLTGDRFLLRDPEVADLDAVDFDSEWKSRYGWLTWEGFPDSRVSIHGTAWVGKLTRRREGITEDAAETPFRISASDHRDFSFAGLRGELDLRFTDRALFRMGVEGKHLAADFDYFHRTWSPYVTEENTRGVREDSLAVVQEPSGTALGAYMALRLRPADRWTWEAGLRYDRFSHTGDRDLAPRVLSAFKLSERTNLRVSLGRYFQSHGVHQLDVGDGETRYSPSEHAHQLAFGVDHLFPGNVGLRLEVYRRTMTDPRPVYFNVEQEIKVFPEASGDRLRIDPDRGRARGLELFIERKSGPRWAWSASYVLAAAEDRVDGSWIPRALDQRHTVVIQTAYQPDLRWSVSLGWRLHTGWPATPWSWDVVTLDDGWNIWTQEFGPLRSIRLPPYHRLDLRVSRRFDLKGGGLLVFLDLFNVYNRANLGSWDYSGTYQNGNLTVERLAGQEMLPFLPTFGFLWEF
ncbi:MAG: TonB-dependent receptor, partial [Longimicrobiales bacterium]